MLVLPQSCRMNSLMGGSLAWRLVVDRFACYVKNQNADVLPKKISRAKFKPRETNHSPKTVKHHFIKCFKLTEMKILIPFSPSAPTPVKK